MPPYQISQSAIKLLHAAKAIGDLAVCVCATFLKPTIIEGQHRKVPSSLGSHDNFYIQYLYKKCGELSLCLHLLPAASTCFKYKYNQAKGQQLFNQFFSQKNYTSSSQPNVRTIWPVAMLEFLNIFALKALVSCDFLHTSLNSKRLTMIHDLYIFLFITINNNYLLT